MEATVIDIGPRVAVNVVDPNNAWRFASIRGRVIDITTVSTDAGIDQLSKKYLGQDTYPFRQPDETRVILKIEPEKISATGTDDESGS